LPSSQQSGFEDFEGEFMRRTIVAACSVTASLLLVSATATALSTPHRSVPRTLNLVTCSTLVKKLELTPGKLTVATDSPVLAPWFKNNQPSNQQGYESALTYRVARALGIVARNVKWVTEPFASSYAPGPKNFDFDINEVVATPTRAGAVTFSRSYYNLTQSLVAMKSDAIVHSHSPAQLKKYRYGVLSKTPAQIYLQKFIKPTTIVQLFDSTSSMKSALESGAIDAIVIDTPTGHYLATSLIIGADSHPLATQLAQFSPVGDEYYALVMAKKSPMVACLNVALASLKSSGELHRLSISWLGVYNKVATIKP
jgi:polar amino acid transport system substrate-binding protein